MNEASPRRRRSAIGRGDGWLRSRSRVAALASPIAHLAIPGCVAICADSALRMLVQLYLVDRGASPLTVGLATSLTWAGVFVGSAGLGWCADRLPVLRPLRYLLAAAALAAGALALLPPASVTLTLVFIRGLLISGFMPIALGLVTRTVPSVARGRAMSVVAASRELGYTLGLVLAGLVLSFAGFRRSFGAMAVTLLFAAGSAWTLTSGTGRGRNVLSKQRRLSWKAWVLLLYLSVGLRQLANAGTLSLIYAFMAKLYIPAAQMGALSAISPAVQVGMMLVIGRLSDRLSRRWVFLGGSALSVLTPLVFAFSKDAASLAVGYAFLGVAFPAVFIGASVMLSEAAHLGAESTSQGLLDSSRAIGGITGPLAAGLLVRLLDFEGMFIGMALSAFLGFGVAIISMAMLSRQTSHAER